MIPKEQRKKYTVSIFGGPPEEREYCILCNTIIYTGPDLIGRIYDYCGCPKQ